VIIVLELVPLCRVDLEISRAIHVGKGPSGDRWIAQVTSMTMTGDRLSGHSVGTANADWVTVVDGIAIIDVRATIQTDDGAYIYVQYSGVQAVGASQPSDLKNARYDWYELRSSA